MITREADYAVRALILLAVYERSKSPITTAILSEKMNIPYRFLRKIMMSLKNRGLVETKKGKTGGLKLKKNEREIYIVDILNIFSPNSVFLNRCIMDKSICERVEYCKLHAKLCELQEYINKAVASLTLDQII